MDYHFKTGDNRPVIEETLEKDLSGATATFTLKPAEGRSTPVVDSATATVEHFEKKETDRISYELDPADTAEAGEYFGEFEVTYEDGGVETFPKGRFLFIEIHEDL